MYITNNYTAATRVRVEIMKAIVKKCETNEERMFLNQFCNRPVIRIANTRTRHERVWTFTDLIETYGRALTDADLEVAYRRAGNKFTGQMKQIFGVLKEIKDKTHANTQQLGHNQIRPAQSNTQGTNKPNHNQGSRKRPATFEDIGHKKQK